LWWRLQARNKRLIAVDLKTDEGQEIVRKLAKQADVRH
jgi:formyl-CoA transferase